VALYPVRFPSLRTQSERKIVLVGCLVLVLMIFLVAHDETAFRMIAWHDDD
jgi:hypothetical protein